MKKYAALFIVSAMSLSLMSGCSSNNNKKEDLTTVEEQTTVSEELTTTAPEEQTTATEEQTTASEEQKEETNKNDEPIAEVSDNLFDNEFAMDGVVISMPASVKAFEELGFTVPKNKTDYMLNPMSMTGGSIESADATKKIFVGFYNTSSEVIKLGDSMLSSVSIKQSYFDNTEFVLAKGIKFGATMDEVKAVYGEPTKFTGGDASSSVLRERMKYENPDDSKNYYEFLFEDKVLASFDLYVAK